MLLFESQTSVHFSPISSGECKMEKVIEFKIEIRGDFLSLNLRRSHVAMNCILDFCSLVSCRLIAESCT